MTLSRLALPAILSAVLLPGCGLFSKKDRPVDINENAPQVQDVLAQVQEAINATAEDPAWGATKAYNDAIAQCSLERKEARKSYAAACDPHRAAARATCASLAGPTASALCESHLAEAESACGAPPGAPAVCAAAQRLGPVRIKSATFRFAAAHSASAEAGGSLLLLSAELARKYGRASTFVIEMIPRPTIGRRTGADGEPLKASDLTAVLVTVLSASEPVHCVAERAPSDPKRPNRCTIPEPSPGTPQLILSRASYSVEITYTESKGGGFTWSASALKLSDGTASLGSERSVGNTLTLEFER